MHEREDCRLTQNCPSKVAQARCGVDSGAACPPAFKFGLHNQRELGGSSEALKELAAFETCSFVNWAGGVGNWMVQEQGGKPGSVRVGAPQWIHS